MMTISKPIAMALAIAGLALVGAGLGAWLYLDAVPDHDPGSLTLLGNVDVRQVNLAFKVPGRVEAVLFEEGDGVKAGVVVAALEKGDFEDERNLARARVERQQAVLAALESGTRPEDIEQARALVQESRAALALAEVTLKRQKALAARDFASHQAHDEAQARLDSAKSQLRAREQALKLAEIGPRREDIDAARSELNAARAALGLAERRLADTQLIAPSPGIILTRVREPGAIVGAGETIYTLSLAAPVWVRTYVAEPDLGRIHTGMKAMVHTDSGDTYEGQVGFISPLAEFTPKTVETPELRTSLVYRLRVIIAKADKGLRQGMPVTVVLKPRDQASRQ
ncbi:MAG: efflux RND transporter periplasmic adaptor subunit [Pseudomonadota bacterium]|jgi:HlyD family secretion protein